MNTIVKANDYEEQLNTSDKTTIAALASLIHESWRQDRFDTTAGNYVSRLKETKDKAWLSRHKGQIKVDIANTAYKDLPIDWKEENLLSAKVAIEKIEDVLYIIHDKWLDRNEGRATEGQKKRYSRLSIEDRLKDIKILEEAVQIIKNGVC